VLLDGDCDNWLSLQATTSANTLSLTFSSTVSNPGKKRGDWDHYVAREEPLPERAARYKDAYDTSVKRRASEQQPKATGRVGIAPTSLFDQKQPLPG